MNNFVLSRHMLLVALGGFLLGFLALFTVHFITAAPDEVHYHANFALYIDGERDELDTFTFYEEVQSCGPEGAHRPQSRAHMHDDVNHVVHVHDDNVTWGHFFANLGYGLSDDAVTTRSDVYASGEDIELSFVLNGEPVQSVANQVIDDKDVLLISYGSEDADELTERFEAIPQDAAEYNEKDDPEACAGAHELTLADRVRRALGLN